MEAYEAFVRAKMALAQETGFEVGLEEINPILKYHQRLTVAWAIRGGKRAIFSTFGSGKSVIQLEICRLVQQRMGGQGVIVCPLGVKQEIERDAAMLGTVIRFVRTTAEMDTDGLFLTNYESVREGKLDPSKVSVISLDECAILRAGGASATFRKMMGYFEGSATYRFVASALPAPNDYPEMLVYADWLGIMDQAQAKTRFMRRDSTHANHLTIHPHKEEEWYTWLASWGLYLQEPADVCPCACHGEKTHG